MRQFFATSTNPDYQEISQRLVIAKDWDEYDELARKVTSTGTYAEIGTKPYWRLPEAEFKKYYRSMETIPGNYQYEGHLTNKKWPLKKVL